ncbi:MAG: TolC family protein [Deltaproteobacteria bacterium]|nr:TolC family protein [Deltaproteobacteria bacterium]
MAIALLLSLCGGAALAAAHRPSARTSDPPAAEPSTDVPTELPAEILAFSEDTRTPMAISLKDAVELTVGQNAQLVSARVDETIAGAEKLRAWNVFVPVFRADFGATRSWREATADSGFPNSSLRALQGGAGVTSFVPTGTSLAASVRLVENSNDARAAAFYKDHFAIVRFELTQSLIRRIGLNVDLASFLVAKAGHKAAEQRLQFVCEQIVQRVGQAYFGMLETTEVYKARREGRRLAVDLYDLTKRRIANGSAAPYEVFQAQSSLAARYSVELAAEQSLDFANEALLQLFNARIRTDGRVSAQSMLVLAQDAEPIYAGDPLEQLFDRALKQRPDFLASQSDVEGADAQHYAAFRNSLPELSARGFVEAQGAAGFLSDTAVRNISNSLSTFDPRRIGNLGSAFQNVGDLSFWNWGVFLQLEVPLLLGAERANLKIAAAALQRTQASRIAIEQQLRTDVAIAHAQQARAIRRVTVAKASLDAARQNLAAETKKMKLGSSTNFDVLRIQDEVINAYVNIATAKAELGRATVNLRFALGEGREGMRFEVKSIFADERAR